MPSAVEHQPGGIVEAVRLPLRPVCAEPAVALGNGCDGVAAQAARAPALRMPMRSARIMARRV